MPSFEERYCIFLLWLFHIVPIQIFSHRHCRLHLYQHHEFGWGLPQTARSLNQRLGDGDSFLRRDAASGGFHIVMGYPHDAGCFINGKSQLLAIFQWMTGGTPFFDSGNPYETMAIPMTGGTPNITSHGHPQEPLAWPGFPSASLYTARPTCRCRSAPGISVEILVVFLWDHGFILFNHHWDMLSYRLMSISNFIASDYLYISLLYC